MSLSEISSALDIPMTSAFDIVHTLRRSHFLREANKRFAIGVAAREVGEAYAQDKDLYGIAKEYLKTMGDELNLAASLVLYENEGLNYVVQYRPIGSILGPSLSGKHSYIHASASGKILLAFMKGVRFQKALEQLEYVEFTRNTITSRERFLEELETVKRQGYAVDDREFNDLLTCISAPLINRGQVVAAVTVSGLQVRKERVQELAAHVIAVSRTISDRLQTVLG
jgi:DNA-binding IclR family transcriptional regulator